MKSVTAIVAALFLSLQITGAKEVSAKPNAYLVEILDRLSKPIARATIWIPEFTEMEQEVMAKCKIELLDNNSKEPEVKQFKRICPLGEDLDVKIVTMRDMDPDKDPNSEKPLVVLVLTPENFDADEIHVYLDLTKHGPKGHWDYLVSRPFQRGGDVRVKRVHAEQPGPAQPATKPADKVPSKNQPSTPTSEDAPR